MPKDGDNNVALLHIKARIDNRLGAALIQRWRDLFPTSQFKLQTQVGRNEVIKLLYDPCNRGAFRSNIGW
jgi:hypothetical protein